MCNFANRITKIAQVAGQAEHDLMLSMAHHWHYGNLDRHSAYIEELNKARRQIALRGDSWAMFTFDRILKHLQAHPEFCEALAKLRPLGEEDTRDDVLRRAEEAIPLPDALLCHEIAPLIRDLERAGG